MRRILPLFEVECKPYRRQGEDIWEISILGYFQVLNARSLSPLWVTQFRNLPSREVGNLLRVSHWTSCLQMKIFSSLWRQYSLHISFPSFHCNGFKQTFQNTIKTITEERGGLTSSRRCWGWRVRRGACWRWWWRARGSCECPAASSETLNSQSSFSAGGGD